MTCPKGLGKGGRDFWADAVRVKPAMDPGERLLLHQACRLVDRLDRFDALLTGDRKAWVEVDWPYEDSPATVVVSSVVSEARQHVSELRQVVKALELPAEPVADAPAKPTRLQAIVGGKAG